jgi:hypothetical protein
VARLSLGGRFVAGKEWKRVGCGVGNNGAISGAVLGMGILHRCLFSGATPSGGADQASWLVDFKYCSGNLARLFLREESQCRDSNATQTPAPGQDSPFLRGCPVQE